MIEHSYVIYSLRSIQIHTKTGGIRISLKNNFCHYQMSVALNSHCKSIVSESKML